MSDLSHRITSLTQELKKLQVQLEWTASQRSPISDQNRVLHEVLDVGLAEELKAVMDQLSSFLWRYVENAAATVQSSDADINFEEQSNRLRQITELLRMLHCSSLPSRDPAAVVERITASVDRLVDTPKPRKKRSLAKSA